MNTLEQPTDNKEVKDQAGLDYEEGQQLSKDGNHAQAANAFHNALIGFQQKGDKAGTANANDKLGDICITRRDFDKALLHFEKVSPICEELEDLFSLLSIQKKKALCYRGIHQYDKAINMYLDLLETYEKIQNPSSAVGTLELIAETYSEMGELEKAADAYKAVASIHRNFKHPLEEKEALYKIEQLEKEMEDRS